MIESFDGGQTLRQEHGDDDQPEHNDAAYRPDQPVSINSSIEIISKKKSARDAMGAAGDRARPGLSDRIKKQSKANFAGARQNVNLNQITSLSQLKRIKVHVEEREEDQSEQVQNKFTSRKTSFGAPIDHSDDDGPM